MNAGFFELEGWEQPYLEKLLPASVTASYHTKPAAASDAALLRECDILSPFIFSQVNAELIAAAPRLKLIATRSTGYDHIDRTAAAAKNIAVANVPEYGSNTVAEHTFALLLALSRRVIPAYTRTRAGKFSTEGLRGFDLRGKLLGVVGTGNIGLHVIRMALSFGMRVIAYDPFPRNVLSDILEFQYVSFEQLLTQSDIITLHCPATKENQHLIRAETIARTKRGVVLINTARGPLVNTHDLLAGLENGHVAAAGLDVLEGERFIKEDVELKDADRDHLMAAIEGHKLLQRDNVIVTPHNAFNSEEAVRRILDATAENIAAFIQNGRPAYSVK